MEVGGGGNPWQPIEDGVIDQSAQTSMVVGGEYKQLAFRNRSADADVTGDRE